MPRHSSAASPPAAWLGFGWCFVGKVAAKPAKEEEEEEEEEEDVCVCV